MINRRFFCLAIVSAALPMWAQAASYPNQPVRVIVSNAPGTGTDITARFLANQVAGKLGQPTVVENKAGAGGVLATDFVARTEPDGYTVLFSTGAHFMLPAIYSKLNFDAKADFVPVGVFAQSPMVVFVPADSPFRSIEDLVAAARKAPDTISYSSPGVGTSSHLAAVMMFNQAKVDLRHIPYKSASQAAMEVASGQAQVGVNGTGVTLPLLQAGKIRILAVTSLKRSASLPDVPTLDESGLKGYDFVAPILALVRAGTPAPIVQTLGDAFTAAAAQPEFKELCLKQGLDVAIQGPAELKVSAPKEFDKARRLSELAGVQAR
ncbi:Bug family tripartite tricarboxylate transporter substrate binding protein [Bordetella bronchiseptica]|uniref:Bug family tripartite tricarboxylate transporter substrate binding protein n=1 Tax=Bordetella bronchiseptica TaxID=518 RepID=UPI00045AC147|nr:tripartite tricarboxylate transporter substrate binding protein [Bordetella bronchiseptica]KAK53732.1 tripartite tricarboxylate transporter family receptor [Bordetella bronchiseptica OSU054]KCV55706.1 tripartite tricarboxylate transporter family receptor [Bordetella bronchiseptica 7E71]KDB76999.1 tripartite tricarboxylate transporter family receptor [Bordetella bronchiseptica CA90 BB1334]KDD44238.1 tripartite tricarboxylate transporter family receptor [Bordetella bronchiseptica OSU095]